jgi:hypothetical protein
MDAIDKKYLKSLVLGVYLVRHNGWLCDVPGQATHNFKRLNHCQDPNDPSKCVAGIRRAKSGSHTDHF